MGATAGTDSTNRTNRRRSHAGPQTGRPTNTCPRTTQQGQKVAITTTDVDGSASTSRGGTLRTHPVVAGVRHRRHQQKLPSAQPRRFTDRATHRQTHPQHTAQAG